MSLRILKVTDRVGTKDYKRITIVDLGHTQIHITNAPLSDGNYSEILITRNEDQETSLAQIRFTLFGNDERQAFINALSEIPT